MAGVLWRFRAKGEREFDFTLLALLEALEHTGKLTLAARRAGVSYRHAWNLIEKWAGILGAPLVLMERGRGTQLSVLGVKLLWAGRRAQARLEPELENLAAELARSLSGADADVALLRLHASHDSCLGKLRELHDKFRLLIERDGLVPMKEEEPPPPPVQFSLDFGP